MLLAGRIVAFSTESLCPLTNTLPFLLSFDLESDPERPRLNIDFHFFDLLESFLLLSGNSRTVWKRVPAGKERAGKVRLLVMGGFSIQKRKELSHGRRPVNQV